MKNQLHRRELLRRGSLLAAGAIGFGTFAASTAQAIEPIDRKQLPSNFKLSMAAYSYRTLLTAKPPKATLFDFMDECAKLELEGTELTSYYFPQPITRESLLELKQYAFRLGLTISGTAVRNDFCNPNKKQRAKDMAHVKQWADHAAVLGAPVIRIFSGKKHKGQTMAEARRLCVEAIEECCEYSGKRGVYLALENHGGISTYVEDLLSIAKAVKSPWFGINFDSGNFETDTPYEDMARLAPYAVNVQIKTKILGPRRKKRQDTDYARVAQILRTAGYRGFVAAEYDGKGDPRVDCPKMIAQMRGAFSKDS